MTTVPTLPNETTIEEQAKSLEQVEGSECTKGLNELSPSAVNRRFSDLKHGRDYWKNANKDKRLELQAAKTRLNETKSSRDYWKGLAIDFKRQNQELVKALENTIKDTKISLENDWKESLDALSKKEENIKKKIEDELRKEYELKLEMKLKDKEDELKKKRGTPGSKRKDR
jgi:hypothetical protein